MLSNNTYLETRIQQLLDGLIFIKKGLGVHVQRMLKMSRGLYTGGNFKAAYSVTMNIFRKKIFSF